MQKVEQKSKWLKSKLDLKKILVQLHNFELNITRVFDHLEIQKFNEDAFDIMDRWKDDKGGGGGTKIVNGVKGRAGVNGKDHNTKNGTRKKRKKYEVDYDEEMERDKPSSVT